MMCFSPLGLTVLRFFKSNGDDDDDGNDDNNNNNGTLLLMIQSRVQITITHV